MCDLITAAAVMAIVGGGVSVYSSLQQASTAKKAAAFNARQGENQAVQLRNRGMEQENALRQRNAQLLSRQRAELAARNINIDSGSALQLQQDTELFGEVDALRLRSNVLNEASAMDQGAMLTRAEGSAKASAYRMQAAGTALSTAGAVADKWYTPESSATKQGFIGDINAGSRGYA